MHGQFDKLRAPIEELPQTLVGAALVHEWMSAGDVLAGGAINCRLQASQL